MFRCAVNTRLLSGVVQQCLRESTLSRGMAVKTPTWKTTKPGWQFSLTEKFGFMPTVDPLLELPAEYADLDQLLKDMPIVLPNGQSGLLAHGKLGDAVHSRLKMHDVTPALEDNRLTTALFRDYSCLAAAYTLEPSHLALLKSPTGVYGEARDHLPPHIAIPLSKLAKKLEFFPMMDYAQAYALNNFYKIDKNKSLHEWRNLKTFRKFHGGADEEGFIIVHIAMNSFTNLQIQAHRIALEGAASGDHTKLADGLHQHAIFLDKILNIFDEMMVASSFKGYLAFRTFIMGITGNSDIFPRGCTFQGVSEEPQYFRGETGAQDSIIPSTDNFLQMSYPKNKLVEYLLDLRQYRPTDHRAYIEWIKDASAQTSLKATAYQKSSSTFGIIKNLYQVQRMRSKHWQYTKTYIINNTKHPRATGGTPITTWLPNNLGSTLEYLEEACANLHKLQAAGDKLPPQDQIEFMRIEKELDAKIIHLKNEINKLQVDFKEQDITEFEKRSRN